ncbi:ELM1/GtrOC1 family putative glycosyltransferase [Thiothrix sp.]|jgi:mitochondrial fission protein ELM1|uniref:ELM1/GtrOC1 family putative glycosyltransferase n=1 Tax=Thiothrix sp. TaxID=1032 RepID=UPI00257B2B43|nr:ELM1/GtrOC1 family putative glycosyltransferase [Thiothrix sp.]
MTAITAQNLPPPLVWITKTTRAGDTNGRIGIAEHLSDTWSELEMPSEFCTPEQVKARLLQANLITLDTLKWPDVLIGPCFHIPYMQVIKTLSGGKTVVVALRPPVRGLQIKAQQTDIDNTDIIVSYSYHNNDNIPNLLLCETVANRITDKKLREARLRWAKDFAPFINKGAVIGLLMGGDIGDKRRIFSPAIAKNLGETVNEIATRMKATLIISVSARTSPESQDALCSQISVPYYLYDPKQMAGDNPYFGILGNVDYLVVTADSISMCSEAASSGKPIYIFHDPDIVEATHNQVVSFLINKGHARLLNKTTDLEKFSYTPSNSAQLIADNVQRILNSRKN